MAAKPGEGALDVSELIDALRGILWGCWRFRWPAIALAWAVCIAGWIVVMVIPDVYRASSRVLIDTRSSLRPLLQGLAVNTDVMSDVQIVERNLLSGPNLEKLAREADLDLKASTQAEFDAVLRELQANIKLARDRDGFVTISYENSDSRKALDVVTALVNNFIEKSLGEKRTDSSIAEKFLLDKVKEYEKKLDEAEKRLADFKRGNIGMMPEEGADYYDRLQGESAKLQDIGGRLRVARNRRAELQRQIEGEEPVFGLVPSDDAASMSVTSQDRQIAQFEQQLAELRLKYTDTHPDIVSIKKTIEELRAEKEAAAASRTTTRRAYSPLDLNPVYQQMKIQLSQVDVDIAQLQAEYADQNAVVSGLRRKVDTIPKVEQELKRLMRDYDITKKQYDELLQRVETARLSEDANQSKEGLQFRIEDPPTVTPVPVGPNRGLLMTVVLLFALLAGFVLSLALNLLTPVFYTGKDLERRFGVPVLGSIRLVHTEVELAMLRQRHTLVMASLGALGICYALLLIFGSGEVVGGLAGAPG